MKPVDAKWYEKSKRWQCSVGSGKNRQWFYSKVEGEQGRIAAERKKTDFLEGPQQFPPGSFGHFVEKVYWPTAATQHKTSTKKGYRQILNADLARFDFVQLNDLSFEMLFAFIEELKARDLSAKRIRNVWSVMDEVLTMALNLKRTTTTDFKSIKTPKVPRKTTRRNLDFTLIHKLLTAAKGMSIEGPIFAASFFGMRRNEVCGLKKTHIELLSDRAIVTIQDNRQTHGEEDSLKNWEEGECRILHVPLELGQKLLSYGEGHDGIYLFHDHHNKPINPDRITKDMPIVCEKAGVPKVKYMLGGVEREKFAVDFKSLRAAFRSNMSALGIVDVDRIMEMMGHQDEATSRRYQDIRDDEMLSGFRAFLSASVAPQGVNVLPPG